MHRAAAAAAADCLQIQFRPDAYICIVFSCLHVFWFGFHCFLLFIWASMYLTIWLADSSSTFRHANNFYAINHFIYENTIIVTSVCRSILCAFIFISFDLNSLFYKNIFIIKTRLSFWWFLCRLFVQKVNQFFAFYSRELLPQKQQWQMEQKSLCLTLAIDNFNCKKLFSNFKKIRRHILSEIWIIDQLITPIQFQWKFIVLYILWDNPI